MVIKNKYILLLLLVIPACSTTKVIERVKIDTIKVASPIIEDSLNAKVVTDTVILSNKVIKKDTVIDVRYYPIEKKFFIKVKPDTVTIFKIDTIQTTVEESEKKTIKEYIGLVIIIGLVLFIIWIIDRNRIKT